MEFRRRFAIAIALSVALILLAWLVPYLWGQQPPAQAPAVDIGRPIIFTPNLSQNAILHFRTGGMDHFIRYEMVVMISGKKGERTTVTTAAGPIWSDYSLEQFYQAIQDYKAQLDKPGKSQE